MDKRFKVEGIVCDYAVVDTWHKGEESYIVRVLNLLSNAKLIAEILESDQGGLVATAYKGGFYGRD